MNHRSTPWGSYFLDALDRLSYHPNSCEEKVDTMIKAKQALQELSVSVGEKWIGKMSDEELKTLFQV